MKRHLKLAVIVASIVSSSTAVAAVQRAPLDQETTIDGVVVACTGIGQTKQDPRWTAYPLRIEFSNQRREYLADVEVDVSARGKPVVSLTCEGAWVLLKVPPGPYGIQARLTASPARTGAASVRVPARGQARIVVVFPES